MYHRYRRSYLWAAYEGKSSNRHTGKILISLTLGDKGLLCAQGSQLINSPLSVPEQANQCSAATKSWMTCALCEKLLSSPTFSPPRQTGKCGQRRRRNGAVWAAEAPPCFCPRRDSLTQAAFPPQTQQHDSLEMQDQAERFAFRALISLRKQTFYSVCRSVMKLWWYSVILKLSNGTNITRTMNLSSCLQIWMDPKQQNWRRYTCYLPRLFFSR